MSAIKPLTLFNWPLHQQMRLLKAVKENTPEKKTNWKSVSTIMEKDAPSSFSAYNCQRQFKRIHQCNPVAPGPYFKLLELANKKTPDWKKITSCINAEFSLHLLDNECSEVYKKRMTWITCNRSIHSDKPIDKKELTEIELFLTTQTNSKKPSKSKSYRSLHENMLFLEVARRVYLLYGLFEWKLIADIVNKHLGSNLDQDSSRRQIDRILKNNYWTSRPYFRVLELVDQIEEKSINWEKIASTVNKEFYSCFSAQDCKNIGVRPKRKDSDSSSKKLSKISLKKLESLLQTKPESFRLNTDKSLYLGLDYDYLKQELKIKDPVLILSTLISQDPNSLTPFLKCVSKIEQVRIRGSDGKLFPNQVTSLANASQEQNAISAFNNLFIDIKQKQKDTTSLQKQQKTTPTSEKIPPDFLESLTTLLQEKTESFLLSPNKSLYLGLNYDYLKKQLQIKNPRSIESSLSPEDPNSLSPFLDCIKKIEEARKKNKNETLPSTEVMTLVKNLTSRVAVSVFKDLFSD